MTRKDEAPRVNQFVRERVATLYDHHCAYCGRRRSSPGALSCDHVEPVAEGGSDWEENLLPACRACNASKADMTIPQWRRHLDNLAHVCPVGKKARKEAERQLQFVSHFLVDGRVVFWFERHRPTRMAPVLVRLAKIIRNERKAREQQHTVTKEA